MALKVIKLFEEEVTRELIKNSNSNQLLNSKGIKNIIFLYANTIKYMKPLQIFYRLLNRLKRELYKRKLVKFRAYSISEVKMDFEYSIKELDFDKNYLKRFNIEELLNDQFEFINIKNTVILSETWNNKDFQHLWRYNLHYFEYLYPIVSRYLENTEYHKHLIKKYKYLIENWIENNPFPNGDGWHPYTISLRMTNWITTYQLVKYSNELDNKFLKQFYNSLFLQFKFLKSNLEKDVLGNHYFENIKALIIGSIFFKDIKAEKKFTKELITQLEEQILHDGMHFELSPMYHKLILEDLIKIGFWLKDKEIINILKGYIQKMVDLTYSFERNFGKTPAFNDSAEGIAKDYKCLLNASQKYFHIEPNFKENFEESGFYVIENTGIKMIFDTGNICPSYLPAHGHCDALSFELSIKSVPLLVNSGTFKYEKGEWRDYFRSTKAHNTIMVSDMEQSQYWGSFRIAERIHNTKRKIFTYNKLKFYSGSYISYLGVKHSRYITIIKENKILIIDNVKNCLMEDINSYIHTIPGSKVYVENKNIKIILKDTTINIIPFGAKNVMIENGWYSNEFNIKKENKSIVLNKEKNVDFFGYLIDTSNEKTRITIKNNQLNIMSDEDALINLEELGVML